MAPRREPLSPARICAAALAILNEDGQDAVTMRRVAKALQVEPMSLYHHVPSKDALLDGVAALAIAGVGTFDDLDGPWFEQVRDAARRLRRELLAMPRAAMLVATRPLHSEELAALVESGLRRLVSFGFDLPTATDVLWLVNDFVIGNVVNHIGSTGGPDGTAMAPEELDRAGSTVTEQRFPNVVASDSIGPGRSDLEQARFERTLEVLIAGLRARYQPDPAG